MFESAGPPPEAARAWSLYRVRFEEEGRPVEQWRLELGDPGREGEPRKYAAVFATQPSEQMPEGALMTVRPHGEVEVHALHIDGDEIRRPVKPDPDQPQFAAATTRAMLQGLIWSLAAGALQSAALGHVVMVEGSTESPAGVTVQAVGTDLQTLTDDAGRFYLLRAGWPGQTVVLRFSRVGLMTREVVAQVGIATGPITLQPFAEP